MSVPSRGSCDPAEWTAPQSTHAGGAVWTRVLDADAVGVFPAAGGRVIARASLWKAVVAAPTIGLSHAAGSMSAADERSATFTVSSGTPGASVEYSVNGNAGSDAATVLPRDAAAMHFDGATTLKIDLTSALSTQQATIAVWLKVMP